MFVKNLIKISIVVCFSSVLLAGCSSSDDDAVDTPTSDTGLDPADADADADAEGGVDVVDVNPALFVEGALAEEITTEDCTLSDGTQTSCYRISIVGAPNDDSVEGPYCPSSINSSAEEGGTWIKDGDIFDFDGDFVANLNTFFDDDRWQMYDTETGLVTVIDGAVGCETAGDPENNTGTDNFCLECTLENLDGGVVQTMLIPVTPVFEGAANSNFGRNNIGLALNGVLLGPPAPLDLIVSGLTIGVFDDCGGHANPNEGYHYHAANGCSEVVEQDDGHSPMIGYALDGYGIFARLDAEGNISSELDECGGETDDVRGYHYHASAPGTNEIIGCFMGAQGSAVGDDADDAGGNAGGGGGPDFGPTAEQVSVLSGVTVTADDIESSLGDDGPPDCDDIINAATSFGVTVEQFIDAGFPPPPGLECDFI